jgi:pyruvyltransferase
VNDELLIIDDDVKCPPIKTYYWRISQNFGDRLTSLLLSHYTHLHSEWANPQDAQLIMAGSILEHLPNDWQGIIAGAGKLHEKSELSFPNAKILAVRGPLTAKSLGLKGNYVLGDPGLLLDELVKIEDKEYDLGLVPHWTDTTLEHNPIFKQYNPKIIRVSDDPIKVITEIGKCKKIVSSALHGIIVADAMAIPRRIEIAPKMLSHMKQEGGLFKWLDYSASLGINLEIGVTQQIDHNIIVEKQFELFDVFEEIKRIFI